MARRGRKLTIEWAVEDDAASLYARYRRERWADVRPRLHALWLVRRGHSAREAAAVLGVDERTVQRWLAWYRAGGLAPIEGRHAGSQGAPSYLTPEQKAELADEVATGRFRTAAEIRRWVEERWGWATPRAGCTRSCIGCGARRRRPAPSTRKSTTWRRPGGKGGLASALHAVGLTRTSRIGFADELRLGLRGTSRRVWGRRGVKVRQRLQLQYDWWYLFAAVDGQAGTVSWTWVDSMKAVDLVPLMEALQANAPLDAVAWDGAASHRDDAVRAVGVPLIQLPAYSPELNPAERLFEEVRRHVEGRVYAALASYFAHARFIPNGKTREPLKR